MSAIFPLSVHRRVERKWAERMKSLKQIRADIVDVAERTLRRTFGTESLLIPVAVRTVVERRRLDRPCPQD
jgi:hypothetical protein